MDEYKFLWVLGGGGRNRESFLPKSEVDVCVGGERCGGKSRR